MSAKEMFEELDMYSNEYEDNLFRERIIEYSAPDRSKNVKFYLKSKCYEVGSEHGFSTLININLDNAIHQQIKEFGWYE